MARRLRRQLVGAHGNSQFPRAILLDPGDPGLAIARSLQRRGVPVTVLVQPTYRWVASGRGTDGRIVAPPDIEPEAWMQVLEELAADGGGVLLAGSDRACEFIARERRRIPPVLRTFETVDGAHLRLMNKASCYALATGAGIRTPRTERITDLVQLDALAVTASYPCLLKPVLSHEWRRLFGRRRVIIVQNADELRAAAIKGLEAGLELLLTEYVPGPEKNLEGAVVVRCRDGGLTLTYSKCKRRQFPRGFGAGTIHEAKHNPQVITLARHLLEASDFVGVAAVEAKRHVQSGELFFIEANVRIPQGFALGDACGVDASWRLYATLAELPLPPYPPQRDGVRVIVPSMELRAAVELLRTGEISARGLLATYRRVRSVSGLSVRDPVPVIVFCGQYIGVALRHLRRSPPARGRLRTLPLLNLVAPVKKAMIRSGHAPARSSTGTPAA